MRSRARAERLTGLQREPDERTFWRRHFGVAFVLAVLAVAGSTYGAGLFLVTDPWTDSALMVFSCIGMAVSSVVIAVLGPPRTSGRTLAFAAVLATAFGIGLAYLSVLWFVITFVGIE